MHLLQVIVQHVFNLRGAFLALCLLFSSTVFAVVDINRAASIELQSLPGIDSIIATAIIDYRNATPFVNTIDLLNVVGIDLNIYGAISNLIIATDICIPNETPDTINVSPISDVTTNYTGGVTYHGCNYQITNYVLNIITEYVEGDCYDMTFTKTNDVIDELDTNLNEFLCTPVIPVEEPPVVPDPDLIQNVNEVTPDWGSATDVTYTPDTFGYGVVTFTLPLCFSDWGTDMKLTVESYLAQNISYLQNQVLLGYQISNIHTSITQHSRTTFTVYLHYDKYDPGIGGWVSLFFQRFYDTYYDGDYTCFEFIDETTEPPLNVADTNFDYFVELNARNAADIVQNDLQNEWWDSTATSTKQTAVNTQSAASSLSNITGQLNTLDDIDMGISELNSTLQNLSIPESAPLDPIVWSASGVKSVYSDIALDLVTAQNSFSAAIDLAKINIVNSVTPSFGVPAAQACDGGVNVLGVTITVCWTQHLTALNAIGLVLLFMASFHAMRILLVG